MQALILAGGKGTRLRPYTTVVPKPLMPVGDYPILEIILRQLKRAGVTEAILAVGHMGRLLESFFQDGSRLGLAISYSFEEEPLGTAGPIALVQDRLWDDFILMNGDLLTTLDYGMMVEAHRGSGADATIGVYTREVNIDFGVVELGDDGDLKRYVEKPTHAYDVSMGVNVLRRESVLPYVRVGEYLDVPVLMRSMLDDGCKVVGYRAPCYWLDIGRIDDHQTANEIFESRRAEFLPNGS